MFISPKNHQHILEQAQALAARYSELGINPDSVATMRPDDLIGNYNFLNNYHVEKGA